MHELYSGVWPLSFLWEKTQSKIEAYLIQGNLTAVVDTGPPSVSPETVAAVLRPAGSTVSGVDLILHTHGHLDHTGGSALIQSAGRARILLHKGDAAFLEDHGRCFDEFNGPFLKALGGPRSIEEEKAAFLIEAGPELRVDHHPEDNDRIDLGNGIELRLVHLPGHSPGSAGYYWEREGLLFSGDCVSGLQTPGGSLPIIYDFEAYLRSIDRLLEMDLRLLLCCHPYRGVRLPSSPVRKGGEIRQFLHDSREAALRIREAVQRHRASPKSLPEIADDVIAELPEEMGFKRTAELRSSLFSVRTVFWCLSSRGPA
jgi:glyoxylase-like metal-dependent hydrolase (beta-lactamase superfamily II)